MKFHVCITKFKPPKFSNVLFAAVFFGIFAFQVYSQKLAVITPETSPISEKVSAELSDNLNALDADLVKSAFQSTTSENIFNPTTAEAKIIGAAIGCDYFVLLKVETGRRNSFDKGEYFESFAVIYLVNSKSGQLVFWKIYSFEDKTINLAESKLLTQIKSISSELKISSISYNADKPNMAEFSEDDKSLRSPLPYKRLKPAYTTLANLYSIAATIDIEVDLNEKGEVTRTEIIRWAGFGLDEAVIETVKKMNWRPALKDGKPVPIRVLLRYNFKKIEKAE